MPPRPLALSTPVVTRVVEAERASRWRPPTRRRARRPSRRSFAAGRPLASTFTHREVGRRDRRRRPWPVNAPAVAQRDLDARGVLDDVVVGEDGAVGAEHHARADALLQTAALAVAAAVAERKAEACTKPKLGCARFDLDLNADDARRDAARRRAKTPTPSCWAVAIGLCSALGGEAQRWRGGEGEREAASASPQVRAERTSARLQLGTTSLHGFNERPTLRRIHSDGRRSRRGVSSTTASAARRTLPGRERQHERRAAARARSAARSRPLCSSTMLRTIDKPRPVPWPSPLVEKNGSKMRVEVLGRDARAVVDHAQLDVAVVAHAGLSCSLPAPSGMAWQALVIRLTSTCWSCP